jgi:Fic family protein
MGNKVEIPDFLSVDGERFWYCRMDAIDRATHELDRRDATREMLDAIGDETVRRSYRIGQLIEEAINSSVLEGARLTTRAQAKAMILNGRDPKSHGERMVVNNYRAMRRLLELADTDLSVNELLEIHAILGDGALDSDNCAGRLRRDDEHVRVVDAVTGDVWFVPPPAEQLPELLEKMLAFANSVAPKAFVHPLIRAIVLHFWLAYLHPFVDGNGRMARALFYWHMLRSGYDFAQYLSISGPIDRSRRSYYIAFAYSETDGGDITYFVLHQLKVLRAATDELFAHLRQRSVRLVQLAEAISSEELNHRQQAALSALIRAPHQPLTANGHAAAHGVTYLTARKDLLELESRGYLRRVKTGKTNNFMATDDLLRQFAATSSPRRPALDKVRET